MSDFFDEDNFGTPDYERMDVSLRGALSTFREGFSDNDDGGVKFRQARDTSGRFGGSLFSKGQETELVGAMKTSLIDILVENYHKLGIGDSGQKNTGTLLRSIQESSMETIDQLEGYTFRLNLAPLMRVRSWGPPVSTTYYGPRIFKGRGPIYSGSLMTFPVYGNDPTGGATGIMGRSVNGLIRTNTVSGVAPKDITQLTQFQQQRVVSAINRPMRDLVANLLKMQGEF